MNRRQLLSGIVPALAFTGVACVAEPKHQPAEPLGMDPDDSLIGDGVPDVKMCIVALIRFLDHADAVLVQHGLEEEVSDRTCNCDHCVDLRSQVYMAEMFLAALEGNISPDRRVSRALVLHRDRCDQREAEADAISRSGRLPAISSKPYDGHYQRGNR